MRASGPAESETLPGRRASDVSAHEAQRRCCGIGPDDVHRRQPGKVDSESVLSTWSSPAVVDERDVQAGAFQDLHDRFPGTSVLEDLTRSGRVFITSRAPRACGDGPRRGPAADLHEEVLNPALDVLQEPSLICVRALMSRLIQRRFRSSGGLHVDDCTETGCSWTIFSR